MAALYHCVDPFQLQKKASRNYSIPFETFLFAYQITQKPTSPGHSFEHGPNCCPQTVEDQHQFCPEGSSSWCWWQRSKAGEETAQRSRPLPHAFFHELKPIFEDLSANRLLESCKEGYTQNDVCSKCTLILINKVNPSF